MADFSANNKRIAKNTLVLYFRQLFSMLVSLYTSRVILQTLGVEDYGIYNVVGGVVSMFSVISGSLSSAISRFMTFELGKGDIQKLKTVFSTSITIQVIISFIVVVLAEIVGVWFLNNKMVIPQERMVVANWIFQFSLITFVVGLISVPYNAAIIAHERMKAFAYIGIIEVLAKLGIVFSLMIAPIDKLIFYGLLLLLLSLVVRLIYGVYCKRNFEECTYNFVLDRPLLKEMFGFAGWNSVGCIAALLKDQGVNILLNLFYGPVVNASRGVALQVQGAVQGFVSNFTVAINPQITKSYVSGEYEYMMFLIFKSARFSFYILSILVIPILLNTEYILKLWLETVPNYSVIFLQLSLIYMLSESLANPLITAQLATGKIRNYQIVVGGILLMNFPIGYVGLRLGYSPEVVYYTAIVISIGCEMARIYLLRSMIGLSAISFLKKVYLNVVIVFVVAIVIPLGMKSVLSNRFIDFILITIVSVICSICSILFVGCTRGERIFFISKIKSFLSNK